MLSEQQFVKKSTLLRYNNLNVINVPVLNEQFDELKQMHTVM